MNYTYRNYILYWKLFFAFKKEIFKHLKGTPIASES